MRVFSSGVVGLKMAVTGNVPSRLAPGSTLVPGVMASTERLNHIATYIGTLPPTITHVTSPNYLLYTVKKTLSLVSGVMVSRCY